jgi:heat-inducible transcriptional repressor
MRGYHRREMQLTPRKREILRRVIEEYVATGQPVGSRVLVERSGIGFSSSTVRGELAELEMLGLLSHPHTSAGRMPTESGYRIYAEELVGTLEGRPDEFGVDLRSMRDEIERALRTTTEMLSDATRLLALVSAPSLETASIRHIELLTLQPTSVMVVVITSTGGVTKRVFRLEEPVDAGLVAWAGQYLDEQVVGERLGSRTVRRRLEASELAPREREFLALIGQTLLEVGAEAGPEVFVGGTAGLVGGARADEVEATIRLVELLERRAAVLELVSEALEPQRPVVHVGPEVGGAELHAVSLVGATYGIRSTPLGAVGLVGPLRMDYEKAIRTVRAAAFELSRFVEDVYEDV